MPPRRPPSSSYVEGTERYAVELLIAVTQGKATIGALDVSFQGHRRTWRFAVEVHEDYHERRVDFCLPQTFTLEQQLAVLEWKMQALHEEMGRLHEQIQNSKITYREKKP